jgi:hypothetical protein
MKGRQDRYSSLIFLLLGIGACLEGISLSPGSFHRPGAGFLPLLAGFVLSFLSGIVLVGSYSKKDSETPLWAGTAWFRTVKTIAILLVFPVTLRWFGFMLSAALTMALLFYHSGLKRWPVFIGASIVVSFLCYLLFGVVLGNEFPQGILGLF